MKEAAGKRMLLYRGTLKSCNYRCSYCPFSKHPMSVKELERDKGQWLSFLEDFERRRGTMGVGALMVIPYGEALIHSWYREGLAYLSALSDIDAVGAQTNLSFPVRNFLSDYETAGGELSKLRLWATFHPEMTEVSEFVKKCRELREAGVTLCAGAVGVPENGALLSGLRKELPEDIYLWINKMDGLKRPYTPEEERTFADIDPYFFRELMPTAADVEKCAGRLFVEGNGRMHTCNISKELAVSWKEWEKTSFPRPQCGRKRCSCFLAYGGREDFLNTMLFGDYPLFRIPRRPKAAFLDVDGTLVFRTAPTDMDGAFCSEVGAGEKSGMRPFDVEKDTYSCPADISAGLEALYREKTLLFFATTLPYKEAIRRCHKIRHLFRGGIFAAGAHVLLEDGDGKREIFYFLDEDIARYLNLLKQEFSFRILTCRKDGEIYKITLFRSKHKVWTSREAEDVFALLPDEHKGKVRYIIEENCLQIVSAGVNKAEGVKTICRWLGVSPKECFAAGDVGWNSGLEDSGENEGMMELCGGSYLFRAGQSENSVPKE